MSLGLEVMYRLRAAGHEVLDLSDESYAAARDRALGAIAQGLDVLAVWLAFRASYRQSLRRERVQVSADEVRVIREEGDRAETVWASPTAFTRVALEPRGRYAPEVAIRLSRKAVTVGRSLGPKQRSELAQAIETAIRSARSERYDS